MIEFMTFIYLFYAFIAFYFLFLFLIIYLQNKKKIFSYPKLTKNYSLSIVVPCYNAEKVIGKTIENLLKSDYKGLKKIIVVDDSSTDDSYKIAKQYEKKYPSKVKVVKTPKNTGCAAGSKNYGAKFVKTELIGFTDDDSFPKKDAIRKMIGFFDNKKVAAVTSSVLVKKREKLLENLQSVEYKVIVFTRKLLSFIDAVYVTPGPLAVYRRSAFEEVNGFDESNITEDIEITWHFVSKGYKVDMGVPSKVYTVAHDTFKAWYRQRLRWNIGGIQTINQYKKSFLKAGMLGLFILPFFVLSWFLGLFGIFILAYRIFRRLVVQYLAATYSVQAQTAILTLREINLTPNVLIFFGAVLFILSLSFTILALLYSREKEFKNHNLLIILIYAIIYLLAYPFILITSMYKFVRGKHSW